MSFTVGQKVVFVGLKRGFRHFLERLLHPYKIPEKCVVYTVSNTYTVCDGEQVIELLEFPSPYDGYWGAGFIAAAFRPVVERKTDISVFTKMLKTSKQKVDA